MASLSEADQALARLDAATEFLPNPALFVKMYVRKEAVLSSQIEGTQASLVDILQHEAGARRGPDEVTEVVNYTRAMNHGLERLAILPLSLRLIREIHAELLRGVGGSEREPGEFGRSQNWIGPPGCTLADATFVPPPPEEALRTLGDLERLFEQQPVVTVQQVAETIKRTYPMANQLVGDLERIGVLREITGGSRNRVFEYSPYVEIFGELRP